MIDTIKNKDFLGFEKSLKQVLASKLANHPKIAKAQKKLNMYNAATKVFKKN